MPVVAELNQGPTFLCWCYSVIECIDSDEDKVNPFQLYQAVKGIPFSPPGQPATFSELRQAITFAALKVGKKVKWYGPDGTVNDDTTFDQLLRDGSWFVIPGVNESVLQPGQNYGHYVVARSIYFAAGVPRVTIIDSYRNFDGGYDDYDLATFHEAMHQNWDPNCDALAFQLV
jgi:hypothetical protein